LTYGHALGVIGDHEGAVAQFQIASEIDPSYLLELGLAYFHARMYEKAYATLKKVIEVVPNNAWALWHLFPMYLSQERFEEGVFYAKQFFEVIDAPDRDTIYEQAFPNGIFDKNSTIKYLSSFRAGRQSTENPALLPRFRARLHTFAGSNDSAFVMLEKAFATQDLDLARDIQSAFFDELRSDPRYDAFIRKLKLEKYIKPLE
jgi:tetratricopeptide (TPR) repeat protein